METESIKNIAESVGIIVGGIWVYIKFIREEEGHAKIEITIDLNLINKKEGKKIVETIVRLENKGRVRHDIKDFCVEISIPEIHAKPDSGELKIEPTTFDLKEQQDYIDPGIKQQYNFLSEVSLETQFITAFCSFRCEGNRPHNTQRTFSLSEFANQSY